MKLSFKHVFLAAAFYSALTLLYFYPSLKSLPNSLIGPPEDNMFMLWSLWYGTESLLRHSFPFMHTHHLFYPEGISLFFSNYCYYGVGVALFLRGFLSLPLIYNLLVLHTFVLAGVGAFCLIHTLTGDLKVSLVGGFIYAFNPSHFAHSLHHVTIASIQFIPFFVLFLIKAVKEPKRAYVLWAALFMTLGALCDWNYLVFDSVFIIMGAGALLWTRRGEALGIFKRMVWAPVLSALSLSVLILPMLLTAMQHPFVRKLDGHDTYVADLLGFVLPHPYHLLGLTGPIPFLNALMTGNDWEKSVYLGVANILIVLIAAPIIWKECRKYFLGFFTFIVLAMGVTPHILGKSLPFPLPYRVIQELPFFTQARSPSRIIVYAYLFLAILVAFSLKGLLTRVRPARAAKVLFGAVSLLIFFDFYSINSAMTPVVLPPCYAAIQKDPAKDFGILELPWDGARYMMYQTLHGVPCVQGYMGRRLEQTLNDRLIFDLKRLPEQKLMLVENHVKYIVIHKRRLTWDPVKPLDQSYQQLLGRVTLVYSRTYKKIYEDEQAATYKVY